MTVGLGVVGEPGEVLAEGPAERVAEVAGLDARHVLDESEEVRARRDHRAADVVLAQPVASQSERT
jgi:hypothetical protein